MRSLGHVGVEMGRLGIWPSCAVAGSRPSCWLVLVGIRGVKIMLFWWDVGRGVLFWCRGPHCLTLLYDWVEMSKATQTLICIGFLCHKTLVTSYGYLAICIGNKIGKERIFSISFLVCGLKLFNIPTKQYKTSRSSPFLVTSCKDCKWLSNS